jgi:hypothetical protein
VGSCRGTNLQGTLRCHQHRHTCMVPVNSGFHMAKNFSENYPQFWHMPLNRFATFVLVQNSIKILVWRGIKILTCPGRQIINLSGCQHVLGWPWGEYLLCAVETIIYTCNLDYLHGSKVKTDRVQSVIFLFQIYNCVSSSVLVSGWLYYKI